jgi:serine/threonine protein kinase/tetratricopeptide (TPR) repeat protein
MSLAAGARLGPYEIIASIGAGGMGEVYRARDPRLDRDVAIKVLPAEVSRDPQALARFEREAKAVAALSHPNILAIFDVGSADGRNYVVTELLEGETLRARLNSGALAWRKAAELGTAMAEGLAAAHSKNVVHRDIKPDNLFLTSDGRVKILDFGLAKLEQTPAGENETVTLGITQTGMIMGTIGYMSPEQVRGIPAGPASDIFSLGCVLYEMVSSKRAFQGQTAAETMSSILRDPPPDLTRSVRELPSELGRLIAHCLEKNPEERFQSARDLAFGLKAALSSPGAAAPAEPVKAANSIAVLPFVNASPDPDTEYLCDGITESIINSLAQLSQLKVTPRGTAFRYKGKDTDPQSAGRELNTRVVLTGRVMQRGETLVVSTELVDVAEGSQPWGERYNRKLADIFELEEEIARKISESLRMKLTGDEQKRLGKRYTENSEAYQLYLRGRHYWIKRTIEGMKKGAEYFQQAIDLDPGYALAYAGLADCYIMLSSYIAIPPREGHAKARAAATTAMALDSELAEAHVSWGFIRFLHDWDWPAAERELRRAIELNPSYWQGPYWYSIILAAGGKHAEAEVQIRRAQELDPLSAAVGHVAGLISLLAGRFDQSVDRCLKGIEIDPSYPLLRLWLGMAYERQGRYQDAVRELEIGAGLVGNIPLAVGPLGFTHAVAGNRDEAQRLLQQLLALKEPMPADPYSVALIYTGLGDKERAVEWLERAYQDRFGWFMLFAKGDTRIDSLRGDPRVKSILQRMRLEP